MNRKNVGVDGALIGWGFYLDKECTKKYNFDTKINEDTDLYVLYCHMLSKFICFVFEGENYYFYVENDDVKLTIDSFVVSAYGKEIDRDKLKFYSDENMIRRIDIVGQTFETIKHEDVSELHYPTKHIYVKLAD